MREIRSLTGLRGVAALLVVIYHFCWFWVSADSVRVVVNHLCLMVDLFFVLSGYVMARQYGDMFGGRDFLTAYWSFLARRIARVWPIYALTTILALLLLQPLSARSAVATLSNLAMVQSWGFADSLNAPAWSISTEWTAYLLFPALAAVCLGGRARTAGLAGATAALAVLGLSLLPSAWVPQTVRTGPLDLHAWTTPAPIVRCIADFVLGLLSFRATRWQSAAVLFQRGWGSACAGTLVVLLILLPGTDVAIVLAFPLLILSLTEDRGPAGTVLGSPPFHRLGELSYSIYLIHVFAINPLLRAFAALEAKGVAYPHLLAIAPLLLIVVAASVPLHLFIEKPCRRLFRSLLEPARSPLRRRATPVVG